MQKTEWMQYPFTVGVNDILTDNEQVKLIELISNNAL